MDILFQLKSRWKVDYNTLPISGSVAKHVNLLFDVHKTLREKRAALDADRELSDHGRANKLKEAATAEARKVAQAKRALVIAERKMQQSRLALTPTIADKTDVAAALLRQEIRAEMREMKPGQILALANSPDTDTTTLEAMFEGPGFLTGLTDEIRQRALAVVLERTAGPQLAAIEEQTEALKVVNAALGIASGELQKAAGINLPAQFNEWLSKEAPPTDAEMVEAKATFTAEAIARDAKALPRAERTSLIDQLLLHNVADLKAA